MLISNSVKNFFLSPDPALHFSTVHLLTFVSFCPPISPFSPHLLGKEDEGKGCRLKESGY